MGNEQQAEPIIGCLPDKLVSSSFAPCPFQIRLLLQLSPSTLAREIRGIVSWWLSAVRLEEPGGTAQSRPGLEY